MPARAACCPNRANRQRQESLRQAPCTIRKKTGLWLLYKDVFWLSPPTPDNQPQSIHPALLLHRDQILPLHGMSSAALVDGSIQIVVVRVSDWGPAETRLARLLRRRRGRWGRSFRWCLDRFRRGEPALGALICDAVRSHLLGRILVMPTHPALPAATATTCRALSRFRRRLRGRCSVATE